MTGLLVKSLKESTTEICKRNKALKLENKAQARQILSLTAELSIVKESMKILNGSIKGLVELLEEANGE